MKRFINLFNWKVENNGKGFIFQPNTIILPKSSIKFDKSLLTMKGLDNSPGISLKNSLGEEVFASDPVKEVNLEEISKNIETAKNEVFAIKEKAKSLGYISQPIQQRANVFSAISVDKKAGTEPINLSYEATSTENIIYEVPKNQSFITKLTNFIKRVFSK